jgi:hypothetical protein
MLIVVRCSHPFAQALHSLISPFFVGAHYSVSPHHSLSAIFPSQSYVANSFSLNTGWRNVKLLTSGECRKIRDCCI